MNHFEILTECYADTLLIKKLGFNKPNHQNGIGAVLKTINTHPAVKVAVIDDDKIKPADFLKTFQVVDKQQNIIKYQDPRSKKTVLAISPAFEDWVLNNAQQTSVSYEGNRNQLQRVSKSTRAEKDAGLNQLLNTLVQKKAPGFVQLRNWIEACL